MESYRNTANFVRFVTVDAFTNHAFGGNPAAVCLLPSPAPELWMQNVAAEFNVSATAFLYSENGAFSLRWFTPAGEVALCGHATLASGHFLWESGLLKETEVARFATQSGWITARLIGAQSDRWIEMDFPQEVVQPVQPPPILLQALKVSPTFVGRNRMDYLVELSSEEEVRALQPDLYGMLSLDARGVIVTAVGKCGADIISRCFYPRHGIPEDPVTGSAHCALAPYWCNRLNKFELTAYQASKRGGWLKLRLDPTRVKLSGQAVTVTRGHILLESADLTAPETCHQMPTIP
jgi:PhzF family phenazine biosynthesis protein